MLLFISGSFPDNQEGIAAGAKVLLDAMLKYISNKEVRLLTTNVPIISDSIDKNTNVKYNQLDNWRVSKKNIKYIYSLLDENINVIHMEYPGDLYGKTFLPTWLPCIVKIYNIREKKSISFNVRLHEFTNARFLRKLAIIPILIFADNIYVPALKDRKAVSFFAKNKVKPTIIGTNIKAINTLNKQTENIVISYFGSVYPGKGIERMLRIWKELNDSTAGLKYNFKIIGDIGTEKNNHFSDYHKKIWNLIDEYGLRDKIDVTGYISDESVSEELNNSSIATLLYEDGLTLRRGSFLAYLSHGIPIITTNGDEEANALFLGHSGITMTNSDCEIINAIKKYSKLTKEQYEKVKRDNIKLSEEFDWNKIAKKFLSDYGLLGRNN